MIWKSCSCSPFQQRAPTPDEEGWKIELVSWSGLHKLFLILICDHQEKHNKDELKHGAGGRIKETEEILIDSCFREAGESMTAARLRNQEDIFLKTYGVLFDKVSIIIVITDHSIFL